MTQGRALGTAVVVFALGLLMAVFAIERYDDAYGWVTHTSDVRLVIGRAVGHAANGASCSALRTDADELADLTADNAAQQDRILSLLSSVRLVCESAAAPDLVKQLASLDAAERELMAARRERLSATGVWTIVAFGVAMAAAIAAIARWLQVRAMRAVVESEERFRMLAANASDLIRIHDARGQTFYASPSCQRLLGYTPEEMITVAPNMLGHLDDLASMKAELEAIQARHAPASTLRYRLRTKAGAFRWFETHTDPVRDSDGGANPVLYSRARHHRADGDPGATREALGDRRADRTTQSPWVHDGRRSGVPRSDPAKARARDRVR